ncbi:ParA family protein (plasmid) [Sphingobium sp. SJ10-10]|uniref:Chromosome (Plasmid) partitioning protein ParA n=1 Tax=Sphingomonas sp. NS2 TaxID=908605 RepID=A0A0D4ZYF6_9SPHN|nr:MULTISPECIES: ParA family protein [unclassified Sphingobium]AJW29199.1 Chromosome (plasmid) partitioning protein ParA [Sphingomonas sp. NS2]AMK26629.1 ParA-like partitioning protein [Sphingobium sp. TKS]MEC6699649.1 ParA family protein [Sphingobium sp. SJ10-10]
MKTIAVNIEKGGAGKTTIACHLAWHLADAGHRVLVLDLDRQCNASTALRDFAQLGSCKQLFENGFQTPVGEGRAIYSNRMTGEYDADYGKALAAFRANFPALSEAYDYCVIDTPPAWSWINFAALMVCDDLIVPVELGPFGPDSTKQLSNSIQTVNQKGRRTPIRIAGLVANRVKANDRNQLAMLDELKAKIGRNLFATHLPDRAHYSQAVQAGVPVWRFDKDVRTSLPPMRAFLEEAMERIKS